MQWAKLHTSPRGPIQQGLLPDGPLAVCLEGKKVSCAYCTELHFTLSHLNSAGLQLGLHHHFFQATLHQVIAASLLTALLSHANRRISGDPSVKLLKVAENTTITGLTSGSDESS